MSVNALSRNPATSRLLAMRTQFEELQRQLATGKKSETYGGLGAQRSSSVDFRGRVADLDDYASNVERLQLRVKLLDRGLDRMSALPTEIRSTIDPNSFEVDQNGKTNGQKAARMALDEAIGVLNTQADGRYLYAGKDTDVRPVLDADVILEGEGGRAGLKQVIAERLAADEGTGHLGRLTTAIAGADVTLDREADPAIDHYGVKIKNVATTSSGVTIAKTTTSAGSETVVSTSTVSFTGPVAVGETITLDLLNPDGTSGRVTLKATATTPAGAGEFTIGATSADTAQNFKTSLETAVGRYVKTDLAAASASQASKEFFDTAGGAKPLRTPSATATAPVAGTAADTVIWYQGYDDANPARDDQRTTIDGATSVSYGARANEDAFRQVVQSLALAAVSDFSGDASTAGVRADRYRATMERARDGLAFVDGGQKPSAIHAEIAYAADAATKASERHAVTKVAMNDLLDGIENVTKEEVAAQILELQTRMQASYQVTSILKDLSLVNFL